MSAFNILSKEIVCPNCGMSNAVDIQFKFGDTWQLLYHVGDTISWGGNDNGNPSFKKVKVYGIIESNYCKYCGNSALPVEYDIFIDNNKIVDVLPIANEQDYLLYGGDGGLFVPLD